MTPIEVGQKAPGFKLAATIGDEVDLGQVLAQHGATVILFYVLDFTPG